jgi:hypothetical protein
METDKGNTEVLKSTSRGQFQSSYNYVNSAWAEQKYWDVILHGRGPVFRTKFIGLAIAPT